MRMVVQKVERASVSVDGILRAEIGNGLMALVGLLPQDDDKVIDYMLDKLTNLRIYEDENDKLNLSVKDVGGDILLVPNFTLYGDARKGKMCIRDRGGINAKDKRGKYEKNLF